MGYWIVFMCVVLQLQGEAYKIYHDLSTIQWHINKKKKNQRICRAKGAYLKVFRKPVVHKIWRQHSKAVQIFKNISPKSSYPINMTWQKIQSRHQVPSKNMRWIMKGCSLRRYTEIRHSWSYKEGKWWSKVKMIENNTGG